MMKLLWPMITTVSLAGLAIPALSQQPKVTFDKLLEVKPDQADRFVALQSEINRLENYVKAARESHQQALSALKQYQTAQQNPAHQQGSVQVRDQLKVKQYQADLQSSKRQLDRLQKKLLEKKQQFAALKGEVHQQFLAEHKLDANRLAERLISGERIELVDGQQALLKEVLTKMQGEPTQLAIALQHPDIQDQLPEYLKAQFVQFAESEIPLQQALAKAPVMGAVLDTLTEVGAEIAQAEKNLAMRVYELDEQQLQEQAVIATQLHTRLDAKLVRYHDLVQLYHMPVPSQTIVEGQQPKPKPPTPVYAELGEFAMDNIESWGNWTQVQQQAQLSANIATLANAFGPKATNVTRELPTNIEARYTGEMAGYMFDDNTKHLLQGQLTLDAVFKGNQETLLSGSFRLEGHNDTLLGQLPQTRLTGPKQFSMPLNTGGSQSGRLQGSFFGNEAQEVGGVWAIDASGTQKAAFGRFKAKR